MGIVRIGEPTVEIIADPLMSTKIISGNKKTGTRPGCLFVRSLTMTYFSSSLFFVLFVSLKALYD